MSRRVQTPDGTHLIESVGRVDPATGRVADAVLRATDMVSGDLAASGFLVGGPVSATTGRAPRPWRVAKYREGSDDMAIAPPRDTSGVRGVVVADGAHLLATGGLFVPGPSASSAPIPVEVAAAAACRTVAVRPGVRTQLARDGVLIDCLRPSAASARAIVAFDATFPAGRSDVLQLSACLSADGGATWTDVPGTASTLARPASAAAVMAGSTPSWVDVPAGRALGLRLRAPASPTGVHLATLSDVSTRVMYA